MQATFAEAVCATQAYNDAMWCVEIAIKQNGQEVAKFTSAGLFNSSQEAFEAGDRAARMFNATRKFPNMCEAF